MLGWLTAEVLALGAATRVWAPVPAWRGACRIWQAVLVLLVVAYPVTMHQGAVSTMHLRWLVALGAAAFVASHSSQLRPAAP